MLDGSGGQEDRTLLAAPRGALLISLGVLAIALGLADLGLGRYVRSHFLPEQQMRTALARGPGCVLVAGDSRMVAGIDDGILSRELGRTGASSCVANISIGALQLPEIAVAVREYLRRGGAPRALVVGISIERVLPPETPPDSFVGNEAIALGWSQPEDVDLTFPEGWLASPLAFDRRFRFEAAQSSVLGSYLSLAWQKVQRVQDLVTGRAARPRNQFGAVAEMTAYSEHMEREATSRVRRALARSDKERLDPWFAALETAMADRHVPLFVVEVPMPSLFQRAVTATDEGRQLRSWLSARLSARQEKLIDLSSPDWLRDEDFPDRLHLSSRGAAMFSAALGADVAAKLSGRR